MKTFAFVDEYISSFSGETKSFLIQLRETILALVPAGTEEKISYGMPANKLKGVMVYFAAWKNHIGFYLSTPGIEAFKKGAFCLSNFPKELFSFLLINR
jgi:uncharacterized protein YdhG (YjbR/CyaY superfamily)